MLAVHEIAIYIHRFHNLDLFRQGWYQIKITLRREGGEHDSQATPTRVAQYEPPDLGSDDVYGVWKIDDTERSFSTQPFRIRYARQDILLSMWVTFNLPLKKFERGLPMSSVILKLELLHTPVLATRTAIQECLANVAVHEFRFPPKALLGLHAYAPVLFDAFHAVLVDVTVHVSLLKGVGRSRGKIPSIPMGNENSADTGSDKLKQDTRVQALTSSRDILIEELKKLSQAINQPIDVKENKLLGITVDLEISDAQANMKPNGDDISQSHSEDKLLNSVDLIGNQVLYLWRIFGNFHRANAKKILEFLYHQWTIERRTEWAIWMVHTKVEMPHQYISTFVESYNGLHGRPPIPRKIAGDPAQSAASRAERHRQSIAQMLINNRSIQDMQIYGDPSRIPVVIVERVVNAPLRSASSHSYFIETNQKDASGVTSDCRPSPTIMSPSTSPRSNDRVLKIVVFVHGFQGHHLDLRLIRNQWLLLDPKIEFLMSEINEDRTSGDFREMGQRLAEEVVSFVKEKMDKVSRSGTLKTIKLSFVGHSIGNLILRTALTEGIMTPYLRCLHTYLSVSGPHLGYLYSSNSLFNGGLWLLKKLKKTQCIHQLTFTDDPELRKTFLYQLCRQKTLDQFQNVILLSSPQDGYVPYHSARIEMCPAATGDHSRKGQVFLEMLNECLEQLRARPSSDNRMFMRCDVNFDASLQGKNLNTMIGRAAHIDFLETDSYIKFIIWSFPELFS